MSALSGREYVALVIDPRDPHFGERGRVLPQDFLRQDKIRAIFRNEVVEFENKKGCPPIVILFEPAQAPGKRVRTELETLRPVLRHLFELCDHPFISPGLKAMMAVEVDRIVKFTIRSPAKATIPRKD